MNAKRYAHFVVLISALLSYPILSETDSKTICVESPLHIALWQWGLMSCSILAGTPIMLVYMSPTSRQGQVKACLSHGNSVASYGEGARCSLDVKSVVGLLLCWRGGTTGCTVGHERLDTVRGFYCGTSPLLKFVQVDCRFLLCELVVVSLTAIRMLKVRWVCHAAGARTFSYVVFAVEPLQC